MDTAQVRCRHSCSAQGERAPRAGCLLCSTIQASTRAKERVTIPSFLKEIMSTNKKPHPKAGTPNLLTEWIPTTLENHSFGPSSASVLQCCRVVPELQLLCWSSGLPDFPVLLSYGDFEVSALRESPNCHRIPLLERVPCCKFCVMQ